MRAPFRRSGATFTGSVSGGAAESPLFSGVPIEEGVS